MNTQHQSLSHKLLRVKVNPAENDRILLKTVLIQVRIGLSVNLCVSQGLCKPPIHNLE
jgi:hypothetical protein